MRERILRILACVIVLLTIPAVLCAFAFGLPAQYDHTFLGELKYKADALEAAHSPRIIVAGGSGAAFGLDSALLESLLNGYSVVNFGMYAGLGSTVMLDLAEPMLREGDIVVFMPEQSSQTLSMYFNAESMWQAADGRFSLLRFLRTEDLGAMVGHFPSFAADKFNLWRSGEALMPEGVYSRAAFNKYGDVANVPREANIMPGGLDESMPISFDTALIDDEFAAYVREYANRCEGKGIRFVYRFCPMNRLALSDDETENVDTYCEYLTGALGCELIGDAESSLMDAGWFYDTNFHLNDAGVVVNTVNMARELAQYLNLDIEIQAELPAMPAPASAQVQQGANSDEAFFEYEISNGSAYITALTEEGRRQKTLVVPASHDGLAVVSFDSEVFAGNSVLEELTIQQNIAHIDNGSFEGCTALDIIFLMQPEPQRCTVGAELLRGTDAVVCVPKESLAAYITNYFWAPHAAYLTADEIVQANEQEQSAQTQQSADEVQQKYVTYHGNGVLRKDGSEVLLLPKSEVHLRTNTAQGTRYFSRDGYVLTGWNTQPDGSGTAVSLGSRIEYSDGLTLYAQWAKADDAQNFTWVIEKNEVHITGYNGSGRECVVP